MTRPPIIRSMLSVPALQERFVHKAEKVSADIVLLDLEDSIASQHKRSAREMVQRVGPRFQKKSRQLFVRPNDLSSGLLELDLDAVVAPWLDGLHLPKVHNPAIVQRVDAYLTLLEKTRDMPVGSVRLIAWIESAEGVGCVEAIAKSSGRLIGMSFGSEDYRTDLGVVRIPGAGQRPAGPSSTGELEYGRARMANAAVAASLAPIDGPEANYRDLESYERDIIHARTLGYRGKYCIHPDQVEIANRVFAPTVEQLDWAERVVSAYQRGERDGLGAIGLDGTMVDRPVYVRARDLLAFQEALQARGGL